MSIAVKFLHGTMGSEIVVLFLCLGGVMAVPATDRIVGGQPTTVISYPEIASLSRSLLWMYLHSCGGTILTTRAIMTAAHCPNGDTPQQWRIRVGSSYSNSGGFVYNVASITIHPQYNSSTMDNDIAIMRSNLVIMFGNSVQAATIPSANFILPDNKTVVAAGWGSTFNEGPTVAQLRHVQIWTVNQMVCAARYRDLGVGVTENMLCAGWLDVGGRDTCLGDSGGPLYYGRVVVGITSWGQECASPQYPGVSTRVSRYTTWIQTAVTFNG